MPLQVKGGMHPTFIIQAFVHMAAPLGSTRAIATQDADMDSFHGAPCLHFTLIVQTRNLHSNVIRRIISHRLPH